MGWALGPDLGIISASGMAGSATLALNRFRELRIPIPQNSRLERARTIVESANVDPSSVAQDLLAETIRTIYEMRWIARALGNAKERPPERLTNALATMLSGPDMASEEEDEKKSKPRNLQFELYIAAILAAGEVRVEYEEPDLRMHYLDEWIGIAAKRPRSRRKIARRIQDAADQVEKRMSHGMVALNVDGLLDEVAGEGAAWNEIAQKVDQLPELRTAIVELLKRPRIRGLLALGTYVCWRTGSGRPQLEMSTFFKWNLLGHSEAEQGESDAFYTSFQSAFAKHASY